MKCLLNRLLNSARPPIQRIVWLCNLEAEQFWTDPGMVQLPRVSSPEDLALVNRLEEMSLLLADDCDVVVLREKSDPDFLAYLASLGFPSPEIVAVGVDDPVMPISEALLNSTPACDRLRALSQTSGAYLLPYASTELELKVEAATGLPILGPTPAVSRIVNSKIYSRRLASDLGLRSVPGFECESLEGVKRAYHNLSEHIPPNASMVLKEAMGVSGKGLALLPNRTRFEQVVASLARRAEGKTCWAFVLEQWIEKSKDINYQLFVGGDGTVKMLALKEILTTPAGAHLGHRFPARITQSQLEDYEHAAEAIGKRLFHDGFTGLVGVDSIIDKSGDVYPVLEINARFNMSTYQMKLERLLAPNSQAIVRYYPLRLVQALPCVALLDALNCELLRREGDSGIIILCWATANANVCLSGGNPAKGRLYTLLAAPDDQGLNRLDQHVRDVLDNLKRVH